MLFEKGHLNTNGFTKGKIPNNYYDKKTLNI